MKFKLLIPTLVYTLFSFFIMTSSQPLKTTIITTTASVDASTPLDSDGHEVQPGLKYHITPIQSNDSGGGLSLASRDGFCPPFVIQENNQLSKGLPLRFLPLDTKQNSITLSSDINILFNAATICVQSTVWRVSNGVGGGSNTDDTVTGRRYYVRSGGMVGRHGVGTVSNWFRIEKVGDIGYKIVFCPSICSSCKVVCGDVGVLEENGKKWLALGDQPLVFMLLEAYANKGKRTLYGMGEDHIDGSSRSSRGNLAHITFHGSSSAATGEHLRLPSCIPIVPMASTEPKTVPPDSAPKSTGNVSEVPTAGTEPKAKTDVPSKSTEAPKVGTEQKTQTDVPSSTPKSTVNTTKVPMDGTEPKTETDTPKSTAKIKTVEVSNISMSVTKKDIWEFFNFSGDIHYIEIENDSDTTQHAFVTFKDPQGAETAVLLTGATIADLSVSVSPVQNYQLPPDAPDTNTDKKGEVVQKAEEVVSTMLAKGFVLGKDALIKAKSFDEKHQLTSNASAKVAHLDRKMGLSQKLKEVNERYQVSEKTQTAIAVAEQKANTASTALMSNPYVSSGAVWFSGAFAAITKAAEGVGSKTKEKVDKEEKERSNSNSTTVNNSNESSVKDPPVDTNTVKKGGESSVKDPPVDSNTVKNGGGSSVKEPLLKSSN
ncbi:hypothetical protein L1887_33659 [Cichorium endivia]|nr:hypothetical protein L1887_33659 [Cichorium endivia]